MGDVKGIAPKTLVVNLYSGPGAGKSTTMAGVFHALKCLDVNCEMGHEFAKEKVWDESYAVLRDQIYVFAKQLHSLRRLDGKVDVIVTDSPLLLSLIYGKAEPVEFRDLVCRMNSGFRSVDFLLRRHKKFNHIGRIHTLEQSAEIDEEIAGLLRCHGIKHEVIDADVNAVSTIIKKVMKELGK